MNNKKISYSDKFNVEATSINDLDAVPQQKLRGSSLPCQNPFQKSTPTKKYFPILLTVMWRKQAKKENNKRLIFSFLLLS